MAKLLLERGADVNAIGGVLSSTPLHWAARHGHSHMVGLLVQHGANPEIRDGEGFTPLHIAAQFGSVPVVAYLVASGQSPNSTDSTNMTPLMWAAFKVQGVNPLNVLLRLGADVNKVDVTFHNTALHWAVIPGNLVALRELLKTDVNLEALNRVCFCVQLKDPCSKTRLRWTLLVIKATSWSSGRWRRRPARGIWPPPTSRKGYWRVR